MVSTTSSGHSTVGLFTCFDMSSIVNTCSSSTCPVAVSSQLHTPSSHPVMLKGPLWDPVSLIITSCSSRHTRQPAAQCSTCCTASVRSTISASPCHWATSLATRCPSMLTGSKVIEVPEPLSSTSWAIT